MSFGMNDNTGAIVDPLKPTHDSIRSPLHTSSSSASRTANSSSLRSDAARNPLQTSTSVTPRPDSSTGVRIDPRRTSSGLGSSGLGSSGLGSGSSHSWRAAHSEASIAPEPTFWRGPRFAADSIAETGIRASFLEDLVLKILNLSGTSSLRDLATKIRLSFTVVSELLRRMRSEQYCEITGMSGNIPQIAITTRGRTRAAELSLVSHYAGPAPVSLEQYTQQIRQQSVLGVPIHAAHVTAAFSHLVLDTKILDKLGTALNSGTSIFLYGPSGTGKTTIAAALAKVLSAERVWIPYAIEVEGQIINVFDPTVHEKVDDSVTSQGGDARWVLCNRPTVLVGGELTLEMVEMQFSPITKFHTAPVQMKANNGIMIIDDFGRQKFRPEELLNRWVVPLDRRVDYLTLAGGRTIEVPFEPCVVFATNLNPSHFTDEAFLRRIQTKIKVDSVSEEQFQAIFQSVCEQNNLEFESSLVDELIRIIRTELKEPLRGCHPRDLVNQIRWKARYKDVQPTFDRQSLLEAVDTYFVRENEPES